MRHYLKCLDCLAVSAIEVEDKPDRPAYMGDLNMGRTTSLTCGFCSGPLRYMGRVQGTRLVTDHTECLCDERCVDAQGPLCSCACGGKNHGIGMLGFVTMQHDQGAAPVTVTPPGNADKHRQQAAEFAVASVAARARIEGLPEHSAYHRKHTGAWVDSREFADYLKVRRLYDEWNKARDGKIHSVRMRKLNAIAQPE